MKTLKHSYICHKIIAPFIVIAGLSIPAYAQFLTADQVRPILDMTKKQWAAVREYDGKDLIYFTHLMAWRCGLDAIAFGINSEQVSHIWPTTPCDEEAANPAALGDDQPLYFEQPLGSIKTLTIMLKYDDGTTDKVTYNRKSILMP